MKLQLRFNVSKKEIAETLSSSFNGSIFPVKDGVRICFTSKNSFTLILRALKKLRNRTSVPQLDVYIKTIEQHITVSVTTQRAHRKSVLRNTT